MTEQRVHDEYTAENVVAIWQELQELKPKVDELLAEAKEQTAVQNGILEQLERLVEIFEPPPPPPPTGKAPHEG